MKVITGPQWLFDKFNNLTNKKGTAKIIPVLDKHDRPIVGLNVLKDPEWNDFERIENPDGKMVLVRDVIEIIDHEPKEDEDFIILEENQTIEL